MDPAGILSLQDAIRHMHGCESTYVESVPVTETFQGKTVWEGEVQVFDLDRAPEGKARLCVELRDRGHQAEVRRRVTARAGDRFDHGGACVDCRR